MAQENPPSLDTVAGLQAGLESHGYIADRRLVTVVMLARALHKPLLVEGEPGVGKTDLARAITEVVGTRLIRLQCYEGLDATHALYEWNYPRQLLHIRAAEGRQGTEEVERSIFTEEYLIKRPLLEAIASPAEIPPVLLIDEIDRADEPFEAFLLEVLSDFQITIPELGTIRALHRPLVILTSNRTREIHDALKRRCLYVWLSYPSFERELKILHVKVPGISGRLAEQLCSFVGELRRMDLSKPPGIAETVELASALLYLGADRLSLEPVMDTLGVVVKSKEDLLRFDGEQVSQVLRKATSAAPKQP
ncbi:MAG TPA: MoxR family ATPase [Candidatus Dormibacteraeota bacterium]